jgi:hypothetical protein
MAEIHYATPGAIRRLLVHIVLVTIVGSAVIVLSQAYQPQVVEWAASDPSRVRGRAQLLIALLAAILLLPLLGFAWYVWRLGTRTLREERFPPEGLVVIRDMLVMRGAAARARGRLFRLIAFSVAILAGLMATILWRLATLPSQP